MSDMEDMTDKAAKPQRRVPGLGRGLNALLGDVVREEPVAGAQANGGRSVQSIDISLISPHPEQPRRIAGAKRGPTFCGCAHHRATRSHVEEFVATARP